MRLIALHMSMQFHLEFQLIYTVIWPKRNDKVSANALGTPDPVGAARIFSTKFRANSPHNIPNW